MFEKYKAEVKAAAVLKNEVAQEQSKVALGKSKSTKFEALAQKYKQGMAAAELHARRVATRVRKKWAQKLINNQNQHTKEILKLKRLISVRQAKHNKRITELRTLLRKYKRKK